jgi:hypothetical protein
MTQPTTDRTRAAKIPCERLSEEGAKYLFHGLFLVGDVVRPHSEMNLWGYEHAVLYKSHTPNPTNADDMHARAWLILLQHAHTRRPCHSQNYPEDHATVVKE